MTNITTGYRELTASVSKQLGTLRADTPDVMKAFGDLAKAASRDGALDKKTKELIQGKVDPISRELAGMINEV